MHEALGSYTKFRENIYFLVQKIYICKIQNILPKNFRKHSLHFWMNYAICNTELGLYFDLWSWFIFLYNLFYIVPLMSLSISCRVLVSLWNIDPCWLSQFHPDWLNKTITRQEGSGLHCKLVTPVVYLIHNFTITYNLSHHYKATVYL